MAEIDQLLSERGIEPVKGSYVTPSTRQLKDLGAVIGNSLPEDYRRFVLKYGCSRFNGVASVRCASQDQWLPINLFLGGGGESDPKSLLRAGKLYRGRMPESVFPFADDPFGNQYCMVFSGDDIGKIFFWDHEEEVDPDDYLDEGLEVPADLFFHNMTLVANDLESFFRQIVVEYT